MADGVVLLSKPSGETSFHALGAVKRALGTGKVGHTGTLDKFAEGLLVVLTGRLTRLCPYVESLDKEYVAEITFGVGTETLDPEGERVAEGPVPTLDAIRSALPRFQGSILQEPPAFSALHVNGKRAYQLARSGANVELPARPVTIHELDLLEYAAPVARLRIVCSKGTYIRALARDMAAALGSCAYVSGLTRTRIGGFLLAEAVAGSAFDPCRHLLTASAFFDRCPGLGRLVVREEWVSRVLGGAPLSSASFQEPPEASGAHAVLSVGGELLAMVTVSGAAIRYGAVFARAECPA